MVAGMVGSSVAWGEVHAFITHPVDVVTLQRQSCASIPVSGLCTGVRACLFQQLTSITPLMLLPLLLLPQGAARGSNQLFVSRSDPFSPGQWVRLVLDSPPTGGLVTDLMSGMINEDAVYRNRSGMLSFISRVAVVGSGWVRLERALPYNVSTRYNPTLHDFNLGEGMGAWSEGCVGRCATYVAFSLLCTHSKQCLQRRG
jgi:hypothetical protein